MGHILFILCVLFCIGLIIFILSNDSKNIIIDDEGNIRIKKNKYGMIEKEEMVSEPVAEAEVQQPSPSAEDTQQ